MNFVFVCFITSFPDVGKRLAVAVFNVEGDFIAFCSYETAAKNFGFKSTINLFATSWLEFVGKAAWLNKDFCVEFDLPPNKYEDHHQLTRDAHKNGTECFLIFTRECSE